MKQFLSILFLLVTVQVFGQFRMVGTASWSIINDSTYQATVNLQADLTGMGYLGTQVNTTMHVFTGTEQIYRVDSVLATTFSSATVRVVETLGTNGTPVGQIMIVSRNASGTIPNVPFGSTGGTAQINAAIDAWNARFIADGNGIYSGSDTLPPGNLNIYMDMNNQTFNLTDTAQVTKDVAPSFALGNFRYQKLYGNTQSDIRNATSTESFSATDYNMTFDQLNFDTSHDAFYTFRMDFPSFASDNKYVYEILSNHDNQAADGGQRMLLRYMYINNNTNGAGQIGWSTNLNTTYNGATENRQAHVSLGELRNGGVGINNHFSFPAYTGNDPGHRFMISQEIQGSILNYPVFEVNLYDNDTTQNNITFYNNSYQFLNARPSVTVGDTTLMAWAGGGTAATPIFLDKSAFGGGAVNTIYSANDSIADALREIKMDIPNQALFIGNFADPVGSSHYTNGDEGFYMDIGSGGGAGFTFTQPRTGQWFGNEFNAGRYGISSYPNNGGLDSNDMTTQFYAISNANNFPTLSDANLFGLRSSGVGNYGNISYSTNGIDKGYLIISQASKEEKAAGSALVVAMGKDAYNFSRGSGDVVKGSLDQTHNSWRIQQAFNGGNNSSEFYDYIAVYAPLNDVSGNNIVLYDSSYVLPNAVPPSDGSNYTMVWNNGVPSFSTVGADGNGVYTGTDSLSQAGNTWVKMDENGNQELWFGNNSNGLALSTDFDYAVGISPNGYGGLYHGLNFENKKQEIIVGYSGVSLRSTHNVISKYGDVSVSGNQTGRGAYAQLKSNRAGNTTRIIGVDSISAYVEGTNHLYRFPSTNPPSDGNAYAITWTNNVPSFTVAASGANGIYDLTNDADTARVDTIFLKDHLDYFGTGPAYSPIFRIPAGFNAAGGGMAFNGVAFWTQPDKAYIGKPDAQVGYVEADTLGNVDIQGQKIVLWEKPLFSNDGTSLYMLDGTGTDSVEMEVPADLTSSYRIAFPLVGASTVSADTSFWVQVGTGSTTTGAWVDIDVIRGSGGSGVSGSGTTGFLPVWSSTTGLGNSRIYQDADNITIKSTSLADPRTTIFRNANNENRVIVRSTVGEAALVLEDSVRQTAYAFRTNTGGVLNLYRQTSTNTYTGGGTALASFDTEVTSLVTTIFSIPENTSTDVAALSGSTNDGDMASISSTNTAAFKVTGFHFYENGDWKDRLEYHISAEVSAASGNIVWKQILPVDCSSNAVALGVPSGVAQAGDWFAISDSRESSGTNNITINFAANGYNYHGTSQNAVISGDRFAKFVYVDATVGFIRAN